MGWRDCGAERTGRSVTDTLDTVNATQRTGRNFTCAVELYIRCQIVWKTNSFAVGQVMFYSKLIGGGVKLAQVVDTRIGVIGGAYLDEIWNCNYHEYRKNQNNTPKYDTAK